MTKSNEHKEGKQGGNASIALLCVGLVAGMGTLAYASVPLYKIFCQVTGYGGTTQTAVTLDGVKISDKSITVRFDANISPSLNWDFVPVERQVITRLGEQTQISYQAVNNSSEPLTGTATFNVTPQSAGAYFNKIECFCFTETTLQPGESIDMPVVFFVDPEITDEEETQNINTITLSYTFFETEPSEKPLAVLDLKNGTKNEKKL